mmetsp:Transcript_30156/g.46069  ORF Transcript_30156/g.46069 Transcript_30156/m.46069 type:complete len:106 (-) Transcript_30156:1308-1625(-)
MVKLASITALSVILGGAEAQMYSQAQKELNDKYEANHHSIAKEVKREEEEIGGMAKDFGLSSEGDKPFNIKPRGRSWWKKIEDVIADRKPSHEAPKVKASLHPMV